MYGMVDVYKRQLYTCMFKEEGHVAVVAEVADTLGADNAAEMCIRDS